VVVVLVDCNRLLQVAAARVCQAPEATHLLA
jgi:hypothetical protein